MAALLTFGAIVLFVGAGTLVTFFILRRFIKEQEKLAFVSGAAVPLLLFLLAILTKVSVVDPHGWLFIGMAQLSLMSSVISFAVSYAVARRASRRAP